MKKKALLLILLLEIQTILGAFKFQCPHPNQIIFDKKVATRPLSNTSFSEAVFTLKQKNGAQQPWSPVECIRQCMALQECHSVLVLHQNMECYGLPYIETSSLYLDNDANYFIKQCSDVPESCATKLWALESLNGFRLLSFDSIIQTIPDITNEQCSRYLLTPLQDGQLIKSAQFQMVRPPNSYNGYGNYIDFDVNSVGKCILSKEDKFTEPESFRVAGKDSWYKENQCVDNNLPKDINRCSYEEYYNQTIRHYDLIIHGITTTECKNRCEHEKQFNCRGFTTMPFIQGRNNYVFSLGNEDDTTKSCFLHSEDVLTHGSWLLIKSPEAIYYRRVTCLNVTVVCTPSAMLITYWPRSDFRGRIYASGHSETCSAPGQGKGQPTKLIIPFNAQDQCGVSTAFAVTEDANNHSENKTLMYTLLVIQNNPIIQAQGDRFVRVGCVAPPYFNLTLGADISVGNDSYDNLYNSTGKAPQSIPATSFINSSVPVSSPKVRMYIINEPVDVGPGKMSGGAVALGETIELRIEVESPNFDVDIMAYHLVASSQLGDNSVLLLDSRGCPTGQVDFPALVRSKIPGKPGESPNIVRLSARFRAFRFPNSHVIKFSVMVQFCAGSCQEVVCDLSPNEQNRLKRDLSDDENKQQDGITFENVGSVDPYIPGQSKLEYENASIRIVENADISRSSFAANNDTSRDPYIVVAATENAGRVMEICKEIKESHESKVPLELSLIVASSDVYSADNLIYGENNKILVAAVEEPRLHNNNMICIHEALFISITFIWLLVQVVILAACMVVIKRYRNLVEDNQFHKNYHSFDNLGF